MMEGKILITKENVSYNLSLNLVSSFSFFATCLHILNPSCDFKYSFFHLWLKTLNCKKVSIITAVQTKISLCWTIDIKDRGHVQICA